MQLLETWGIHKIRKYYSYMQKQTHYYSSIEDLFKTKILYKFTLLAFLIGFILTVPLIYIEIEFDVFNFNDPNFKYIFSYLIALIIIVTLEFYLLFILGFYTLAYYIYHLYHINQTAIHSEEDFLGMLSRTVMELPEKNDEKYNIDHQAYSDKDIAIFTLLYKLKVVTTNFVLKFIVKKALTRSTFRGYSAYVATIGTGAWDAYVFYKTTKHGQYKIMVRYAIMYLIKRKMNLLTQEDNIKAILSRYYHYGEYNNNLDYLLGEIHKITKFNYSQKSFLEEDVMKKCNQELLLLVFAFKEKIHSKREKKIIESLNEDQEIKQLREAFKLGNLNYITKFIDDII